MNPILKQLMPQQSNNIMSVLGQLKSNPNMVFNQMMQNNPQFAQFVQQNKGKSPEQIAKENGINIEDIYKMMK